MSREAVWHVMIEERSKPVLAGEGKDMRYRSTRGGAGEISASKAILSGLAEDGGLFMPLEMPRFSKSFRELSLMTYQELACEVMRPFLDDFSEEELRGAVAAAYDEKFDTKEIAPIRRKGECWYLELFHGSTIAFKDLALSILPHFLTLSARKNAVSERIVILTATSGDTGKAAMAGFQDVPGTEIIVFYPKDGVSRFQELQMRTQKGRNTHVAAVEGNFDDAQTGVKRIFSDKEFAGRMKEKGFLFSSANSINIGRLLPQVVYYVYAYCRLLSDNAIEEGEAVNFCVPTGNFGNILAGFFAKEMGLPVGKLICASNENRVLSDFFRTGIYDRKRPFVLTSSPSMDILVSSNLERLIYLSCGGDSGKTAAFMRLLSQEGRYGISPEMSAYMEGFYGDWASEAEVFSAIRRLKEEAGYVIDPHTAVAKAVYDKYVEKTGDSRKTVIVSTASPYKFAPAVLKALGEKEGPDGAAVGAGGGNIIMNRNMDPAGEALKHRSTDAPEDSDMKGNTDKSLIAEDGTDGFDREALFSVIDRLRELSGVPEPAAIQEVRNAGIRHSTVTEIGDMEQCVESFLRPIAS